MTRRPKWLLPLVVAIYALILAPLVVVIGVSFTGGDGFDFPPASLSLRWYYAFAASKSMVTSFFYVSLIVALATSLLAILVGTLAAIGIVRFRFRGTAWLESLFLSPIFVPHILLGTALYLYFARLNIKASLASLVLGHLLVAIPYVVRIVISGLVNINPRLEEAAKSLGAGPVKAFVKATLPLLSTSLVSGAIFAFIISFGDINLSLFLSGPELSTIPVNILSQIQWGGDPTIAAASSLQILVVGVLLAVVQRLFGLRVVI